MTHTFEGKGITTIQCIKFLSIDLINTELSLQVYETSRVDNQWRSGRRIVELGVLADGLAGCKKCGLPLHLHHTTGIINYGVSALLKIPCLNTSCNHINNVPTGKKHNRVWDANSKLVAGKYSRYSNPLF